MVYHQFSFCQYPLCCRGSGRLFFVSSTGLKNFLAPSLSAIYSGRWVRTKSPLAVRTMGPCLHSSVVAAGTFSRYKKIQTIVLGQKIALDCFYADFYWRRLWLCGVWKDSVNKLWVFMICIGGFLTWGVSEYIGVLVLLKVSEMHHAVHHITMWPTLLKE